MCQVWSISDEVKSIIVSNVFSHYVVLVHICVLIQHPRRVLYISSIAAMRIIFDILPEVIYYSN